MEKVYKHEILRHLSHREYMPVNETDLARIIGVPSDHNPYFRNAFDQLIEEGKIVLTSRGLVDLPKISGTIIGTFRSTKKGFGFVEPREASSSGDLFVAERDCKDAMNGDVVLARVQKKTYFSGEKRYAGQIIKIIERGQKCFAGTLKNIKGGWIVEPDGRNLKTVIFVDDVTAKGAQEGDKVSVDILEYPKGDLPARGVILEVLGKTGHYDAELKAIISAYDLPGKFKEKCIDQAHENSVGFDAVAEPGIEDITDKVIVTIDPPDAKDFDDAISLRKTSTGNYILGVHIADVSRFIPMGSPLDDEAKHRGNSIYLPGKVIPMLPEMLSNGICSLQPGQKRYAKSAYITYSPDGKVLGSEFANSLMKSTARLTYLQADDILKGKTHGFSGEVVGLLKDMEVLARAIEKRRIKDGMIQLDLPEVQLVMDKKGKVVDAHPAETSYPHTIIEMFMVEANVAVASMLDRFRVPFIRRIHPDPDAYSLKNVSNFVNICGIRVPKKMDRQMIQQLLDKVRGTSYEFAVNNFVLRSFTRAEYSPLNIGHFALASRNYCHFTSPIRRYADLTVHRLLQCYLEEKLTKIGLDEILPEAELLQVGKHISSTEENATDAERELKKILILQMLSTRIGEELNCVVSGLTNFGIFVQCIKFGIEGMIPLHELGIDEWKFEEKTQSVVGKHSGKRVRLGDSMKVKIVSVNVPGRHLDVMPSEPIVSREDWLRKDKKGKRLLRKIDKNFKGKRKKRR